MDWGEEQRPVFPGVLDSSGSVRVRGAWTTAHLKGASEATFWAWSQRLAGPGALGWLGTCQRGGHT